MAKRIKDKVEQETTINQGSIAVRSIADPKMGITVWLRKYPQDNRQIEDLMRVLYKKDVHTNSEWQALYNATKNKKYH